MTTAQKTVKLIIVGDASDAIKEVDQLKDGLSELDQKQARDARNALDNVNNAKLNGVIAQVKQLGKQAKELGNSLKATGQTLTAAVTLPIVGLGAVAVKAAVDFDSLKRGLTAVSGSAAEAEKQIARLREVAKLPGLGFKEAVQGSINLQAAGLSANQAERALAAFGNALATVGKGKSDLDGVVLALQQIQSKGKISAEEINQLNERVPQIRKAMKDAFGTSNTEELQKMGIDSTKFVDGITKELEKLPKVTGGAANSFENLQDSIEQALLPLGNVILPFITKAIDGITPVITALSTGFASLSPATQVMIVAAAGLAAALGPVLIVIGSLIAAIGSIATGVAAAAAALGGFAALGAVIAVVAGAIAGLVAGVGLAIGVAAALSEAWQGAWGPIGSIVAVAIGAVMTAISPILGIPVLLTAVAVTVYKAWETNFGGLRDFTSDVWSGIQSVIGNTLNEIRTYVSQVLAGIQAFWRENGADISRAAKTVYDGIANTVSTVLTSIRSFWTQNGAAITAIAKGAWDIIKGVVTSGIGIVLNVIKLVAAVINGDWGKAWEAAKGIVKSALSGIGSILSGLSSIIGGALKLAWNLLLSIGSSIAGAALQLGRNIVQGIANGISGLAQTVYEKARSVATNTLAALKGVFVTKSPSRATFEIGQHVTEGLALGILARLNIAKASAKEVAKETLDELRRASDEFTKLAGLSGPDVEKRVTATKLSEMTSGLEEILKLRSELGTGTNTALPSSFGDIDAELKLLRDRKAAIEAEKQAWLGLINEIEQYDSNLEKIQSSIRSASDATILDLQEEQQLLRITDPVEKERIKNAFELRRLRVQMQADGFFEDDIDATIRLREESQKLGITQLKLLEKRRQIKGAEDFATDLLSELNALKGLNPELSTYEKTLQRIASEFPRISEAQKEYLLGIAAQIDAQKEFQRQYEETYNWIRSTFDILTESGKSWSDKLKTIFGGVVDHFKKMLLDMAAAWLTSKLLGNSNGQSGGSGGFLSNLLGGLFGNGQNAGQGSSGGLQGLFGSLTGGGSGGGGLLGSFGNGGGLGGLHESAHAGSGSGGEGGNLAGTLSMIGAGAAIIGGLIPGKAGSVISATGTGLAIGAQIGSAVPIIGTAIGAAIGAAVGFFSSIFGSAKRKRDKNEKLPALMQGFSDSLTGLTDLISKVRTFEIDPDTALSQGREIRSKIASGFGISFESKKYRKLSQDRIRQQLTAIDTKPNGLMAQLESAVEIAKAAGARDKQILPEFANGAFISRHFRRVNGSLGGAWSGRDYIPALLADAEMVLNPSQQASVIRNAGGRDVFAGAGIPNYSAPKGMAAGGFVNLPARQESPTVVVQPNFTLVAEGITFDERSRLWLESDDGQRTLVRVVDKQRTGGRL